MKDENCKYIASQQINDETCSCRLEACALKIAIKKSLESRAKRECLSDPEVFRCMNSSCDKTDSCGYVSKDVSLAEMFSNDYIQNYDAEVHKIADEYAAKLANEEFLDLYERCQRKAILDRIDEFDEQISMLKQKIKEIGK